MSSTTFTVLRCDRCGHEDEIRETGGQAGWGKLGAMDLPPITGSSRPRAIGVGGVADDLCPGCTDLLFAWWENREPVMQPVTLPAAPPVRRFTIEDRRIAMDAARDAMRAQVEAALAAVREEPTSLLDGQIVPGGLTGIDERAADLVGAIVALFSPEQHTGAAA